MGIYRYNSNNNSKVDSELEEIDLTGWNTENLTNLGSTFATTPDIKVKGIESLNTQKVTSMSGTFRESQISKLDLSGWRLDKCTSIAYMFEDCNVEELTGTENWRESKIQEAQYAFARMYKIKHIDLNNLDMSLCHSMHDMFACNSFNGERGILESLEIGNNRYEYSIARKIISLLLWTTTVLFDTIKSENQRRVDNEYYRTANKKIPY